MLVRVVVCLLVFYLYRLAARNGSNHCIVPTKKNKRYCLFGSLFVVRVFDVSLFICLFVCLVVRLIHFSFVSFLVSLLFGDRCANKCPNLDEYVNTNRQTDKVLKTP